MSEERKQRGWGYWTTVVLIVLFLYLAATGPAKWLYEHGYISEPVADVILAFYYPLHVAMKRSSWFDDAMRRYGSLWAP